MNRNISTILMHTDLVIDPKGQEAGVYNINHIREEEANAEFKYIEAADTRIVVAMAKRNISSGEEILATYAPKYLLSLRCSIITYTDNRNDTHDDHHDFDADYPPQVIEPNQYRIIRGISGDEKEDEGEADYERWVGKVLTINPTQIKVQWALRSEDITSAERKKFAMRERELLMTTSRDQRDTVQIDHVERVVTVSEGKRDLSSEYWWQRIYSGKGTVTGDCINEKARQL
jgi:hypothetical protein